jgi:hypothetical protein
MLPLTKLQQAEQLAALTEAAMDALKHCADERRKLTHEKHRDPAILKALDLLEVLHVGDRAYMNRIRTLGR